MHPEMTSRAIDITLGCVCTFLLNLVKLRYLIIHFVTCLVHKGTYNTTHFRADQRKHRSEWVSAAVLKLRYAYLRGYAGCFPWGAQMVG